MLTIPIDWTSTLGSISLNDRTARFGNVCSISLLKNNLTTGEVSITGSWFIELNFLISFDRLVNIFWVISGLIER
jgi:hypothetical protein